MKRSFTIQDLKASKAAGLNQELIAELEGKKPRKKNTLPAGDCQQVRWMWGQLAWWSITENIEVVREYRFHPERKWRFDFFIPKLNCAAEYEGIFAKKSRHTTVGGYSGDVEKYREAAKMGIAVLRYTSKDYKKVLSDLNKIIK